MSSSRLAIIVAGLLVAQVVSAAFTPSQWQYRKQINVQQTGYVRLNLDAEAFAGLQPDLRDLRVVDGTGAEVPFKLVVEREAGQTRPRRVSLFNNAYTQGQYQSFVVNLGGSGQTHNWIRILTSERNFQKQVEIAGSDDQQNWQVLKSDGYIFGHTEPRRGFVAQETTLTYPTATFRYLRVKIFSATPFPVSGVEVTEQVASFAKEVTFRPAVSQTEDAATQSSVLTLDFGQGGLPTRELTLQTAATNFDRPAELWSSTDGQRWRRIGSGYLFRVAQPKFSGSNLTLTYPETAARYLRLDIYNGDDRPLGFTGATARGTLRSVVFNAQRGGQYFLSYGNVNARYPEYDLERLFPYLEVPAIAGATLGPKHLNPAFVAPLPPVVPFTERYPWLLPMLLVVVALGLLGLIARFVRQVKPPSA